MNAHGRRKARRARAKEILRAFGLAMRWVSEGAFRCTAVMARAAELSASLPVVTL